MHATRNKPADTPADLQRLRGELNGELRRAGYTADDLVEAVADYFRRELAERGGAATAVLLALFLTRLRRQARHQRVDSERAARADAPRCGGDAHAGSTPPSPQRRRRGHLLRSARQRRPGS